MAEERESGKSAAKTAGKTQTFAEWLVENMAKHGLSQADIARALDVDPAAVSRWVAGRSYPISHFRKLLAVGFDVPEDQIPSRHAGRKPEE